MSELANDDNGNPVPHANTKSCDPAADTAPEAGLRDVPATEIPCDDALIAECDAAVESRNLIALCQAATQISDRMDGWLDPLGDIFIEMVPHIAELRATTAAERAAKAGIVLRHAWLDLVGDASLGQSLARDVLAAPVA